VEIFARSPPFSWNLGWIEQFIKTGDTLYADSVRLVLRGRFCAAIRRPAVGLRNIRGNKSLFYSLSLRNFANDVRDRPVCFMSAIDNHICTHTCQVFFRSVSFIFHQCSEYRVSFFLCTYRRFMVYIVMQCTKAIMSIHESIWLWFLCRLCCKWAKR